MINHDERDVVIVTDQLSEHNKTVKECESEHAVQKGAKHCNCVFSKELFDLNKQRFSIMMNIHDMNIIPHKHDFFQLEYVYSGKSVQYINGERVELEEGSIVVFNKQVVHSVNRGSSNDMILFIGINESIFDDAFLGLLAKDSSMKNYFFKSLYEDIETNDFLIVEHVQESVGVLLKKMYHEFLKKQEGFEENMTAYLMLFINKLHQQSLQNRTSDADNKHNSRKRINMIMKYLDKHYQDATLTSLADYIHVHPNYLSSFIKEQTTKTFNNLLTGIRLKKACYLLIATELSIESISKEVGYKNPNYFYKVFKQEMKLTPNAYRKKYRFFYN